jgi:DNA processing protein
MPPPKAEVIARATLTYLAEPGDPWLGALARDHGAERAVAAVRAGRFPDGNRSASAAALRAMDRWRLRLAEVPAAAELDRMLSGSAGIRLLCPGDPQWPRRLRDLGDSEPYALWARGGGDLGELCERAVSIVGSRAATAYGSFVAAEIGATVAARGWTVISGGAYGIDGSAHRGALAGRGVTIAVMACGVDRPYPVGHTELLASAAQAGGVISEWPPGRSVARIRFLVRNRVIAALSAGTVVVEAGKRSGALNTARHALELGRPLMAVPGPVTSDLSAGCHSIIRDWAGMLVTSAEEVLEALGSGSPAGPAQPRGAIPADIPAATSTRGTPSRADRARDALDLEAATVLDALPARGALPTTDIAIKAALEPAVVLEKLAVLAVYGLAERTERGWRVRHEPR